MFYEIVIAPGYTPEGLECLKGKSKNLRILEAKPRAPSGLSLRQVGAPHTCLSHTDAGGEGFASYPVVLATYPQRGC